MQPINDDKNIQLYVAWCKRAPAIPGSALSKSSDVWSTQTSRWVQIKLDSVSEEKFSVIYISW